MRRMEDEKHPPQLFLSSFGKLEGWRVLARQAAKFRDDLTGLFAFLHPPSSISTLLPPLYLPPTPVSYREFIYIYRGAKERLLTVDVNR